MIKKIIYIVLAATLFVNICQAQDEAVSNDTGIMEEVSEIAESDAAVSETEDSQTVAQKIISYVKEHTGLTVIIIVFILMLIVPFIPAFREMIHPKDNKPMLIDQEYTRDPRFLDKHLLEELKPVLDKTENAQKTLKYKNSVPIDIVNEFKASDPYKADHVLIVSNDMKTASGSTFKQPVYVKGKASIGENCSFDILMAENEVTVGRNLTLEKWMSSNANIKIGQSATLGKRVACDGILQIGKGCRFRNLYAMPVSTYDVDFNLEVMKPAAVEFPDGQMPNMTEVSDSNWYVAKGFMTIPPYSMVNNSMIVKSDLVLRQGVVVNGNIKVYGKVTMEKDVRIYGELICNGDIEVGEFSYIRENLFTQSQITIKNGVRIGLPGQNKSIIGKKGINLDKNVIIYGNVMTAGEGLVI